MRCSWLESSISHISGLYAWNKKPSIWKKMPWNHLLLQMALIAQLLCKQLDLWGQVSFKSLHRCMWKTEEYFSHPLQHSMTTSTPLNKEGLCQKQQCVQRKANSFAQISSLLVLLHHPWLKNVISFLPDTRQDDGKNIKRNINNILFFSILKKHAIAQSR